MRTYHDLVELLSEGPSELVKLIDGFFAPELVGVLHTLQVVNRLRRHLGQVHVLQVRIAKHID